MVLSVRPVTSSRHWTSPPQGGVLADITELSRARRPGTEFPHGLKDLEAECGLPPRPDFFQLIRSEKVVEKFESGVKYEKARLYDPWLRRRKAPCTEGGSCSDIRWVDRGEYWSEPMLWKERALKNRTFNRKIPRPITIWEEVPKYTQRTRKATLRDWEGLSTEKQKQFVHYMAEDARRGLIVAEWMLKRAERW